MRPSRLKNVVMPDFPNNISSAPETGTDEEMFTHNGIVRLVRSFIAVFSINHQKISSPMLNVHLLGGLRSYHAISADKKAELAFIDDKPRTKNKLPPTGRLTLLIGDESEWKDTKGKSCMAYAVCLKWDPIQGTITVLSSIVALPPIYFYVSPSMVVVTTELSLLLAVSRLRLTIDPQGILELFGIGYPIGHRTLFNDVTLMPGGCCLRVNSNSGISLIRSWRPSAPEWLSGQISFVDLQVEAFKQAMKNLDLTNSIFTLTGGLDTRTILAYLSSTDIKPITCTISGMHTLCLDARLAIALCKEYGLRHILIKIDEQFIRDLPIYVVESSRLSGGLVSVLQAHEVYFYKQLEGLGSKRLSGNLGNQICREGVEGISMRGAESCVLHEDITKDRRIDNRKHWICSTAECSEQTFMRLLLECEVPFSSVGNFSIGHSFMVQQTPYANLRLIEITLRSPLHCNLRFTPNRARLRDVRHRFLGQSRDSFQCKFINTVGGAVARHPINYGWRSDGFISLRGVILGVMAFIDAVSSAFTERSNLMQNALSRMGIVGMNEITQPNIWIDSGLNEFVNDTLRSRKVIESGLFTVAALERILNEHYSGNKKHYTTVIAALDLALAHQIFVDSTER